MNIDNNVMSFCKAGDLMTMNLSARKEHTMKVQNYLEKKMTEIKNTGINPEIAPLSYEWFCVFVDNYAGGFYSGADVDKQDIADWLSAGFLKKKRII